MKVNLKDIKTEKTHNATTFRKRLITTEENKGKLATCNYAWLKTGKQLEQHSHPDGEEFYLILEGQGEMLVGEKWFSVKKDDFITVPHNKIHSLKNNQKKDLIFLTIRTISN